MIVTGNEFGLAGYFKIEAHQRTESGIEHSHRVVSDWFPNLITNNGLELLKGGPGILDVCQVGSGNTPPAFTDTALVNRIGQVLAQGGTGSRPTAAGPNSAVSPYYSSVVNTYVFPPGGAAGNLSEIGISRTIGGTLFSRALILDAAGNPTTITILSIEYLTVTYQLRVYRTEGDVAGSFVVNGVTYTTVSRPMNIASASVAWVCNYYGIDGDSQNFTVFSGPVGIPTGGPTGTAAPGGVVSTNVITYGPTGQYYMDKKWSWPITLGNITGGFQSAGESGNVNRGFCTQVGFSPPVPKDNTKTMSMTIRTTWGRYP